MNFAKSLKIVFLDRTRYDCFWHLFVIACIKAGDDSDWQTILSMTNDFLDKRLSKQMFAFSNRRPRSD